MGLRTHAVGLAAAAAVTALAMPLTAYAQSLGTFRWQLQPYCNVLTVSVVQDGAVYHIDGTDDLCGAPRKAAAVGLAFPNPDGSIGLGLATVTAPGGTPVHVDATIGAAGGSGTWRDSAGNSGAFVLTPGAGTGGATRPLPSRSVPAGSITGAEIAAGAAGSTHIGSGAITTGHVAAGAITSAHLRDGPRAAHASGQQAIGLSNTPVIVRTVSLNVPATGTVLVNASGLFQFDDSGPGVETAKCSITTTTSVETSHLTRAGDGGASVTTFAAWASTRGFDVTSGPFTVNVVCAEDAGNVLLFNVSLNALYVAR